MTDYQGKRARSDSAGSAPDQKRQAIQASNGSRGYASTHSSDPSAVYNNNMAGDLSDNGDLPSSTLPPVPASAGLPEPPSTQPEGPKVPTIAMRALIVTQDASVIIGRSGTHIREIREKSGAKVDVTPQIQGNPERILNVSGPLDAVSKAFGLVVRRINDEPYDSPSVPGSRAVTVRFIIPNARMGSVIGKGGSKIKEIQEASGARLQASEAMLPGSTERVLTVSGVADAIHIAVYYVGTILQEHADRMIDNRQYRPGSRDMMMMPPPYGGDPREREFAGRGPPLPGRDNRDARLGGGIGSGYAANAPGNQTQHIYVPDELVASIIGKGGQKINEIRYKSGTHIKIMEPSEMVTQDTQGQPGERLVTITGQPTNIQAAVSLLYARLEEEKQKQLAGIR